MAIIKIGDFVTWYEAGYWQLIDIKPKIADSDYKGEDASYKKGDIIGKWVVLKKAFTPKMKPRIEFSYGDASWLRPISAEVDAEIRKYFEDNPDYKTKFDNAEVKLRPSIINCWIDLPETEEDALRVLLSKLPAEYTMDEFWKKAKRYKKYVSKPPVKYILNFFAYPWNMDKKSNLIYFKCELEKL